MAAIYLAGRYGRRNELLDRTNELRVMGHEVTARWLGGAHEAKDSNILDDPKFARECAGVDVLDVQRADICISFTESPKSEHSRGGRHVEFGMAYAWGKRLIVIGPLENIFHTLRGVEQFDDWATFMAHIQTGYVSLDTVSA